MNALDDNPSLLQDFQKFLTEESNKRNVYSKVEDSEKKSV